MIKVFNVHSYAVEGVFRVVVFLSVLDCIHEADCGSLDSVNDRDSHQENEAPIAMKLAYLLIMNSTEPVRYRLNLCCRHLVKSRAEWLLFLKLHLLIFLFFCCHYI